MERVVCLEMKTKQTNMHMNIDWVCSPWREKNVSLRALQLAFLFFPGSATAKCWNTSTHIFLSLAKGFQTFLKTWNEMLKVICLFPIYLFVNIYLASARASLSVTERQRSFSATRDHILIFVTFVALLKPCTGKYSYGASGDNSNLSIVVFCATYKMRR